MIKKCDVCGDSFETKFSWASMCKQCFVDEKKSERNDLLEAVGYWKQRAEQAEHISKNTSVFEPDVLKKIIHLCHPDKHNNSEIARNITCYLLKLRK